MREKLKYLALNMTSTNKKLYQMLMDQLLIMLIAFLSIKLTELESYQTSNMSIWISSAVTAFLTIVMLTVTQFYKTVVSAVTLNFIKIVIFAALASSFFSISNRAIVPLAALCLHICDLLPVVFVCNFWTSICIQNIHQNNKVTQSRKNSHLRALDRLAGKHTITLRVIPNI